MKWKIRLARDMGQEAFVVIEAPTSEEAEAILWHDMDPDVIRWSDDDVMGDREVREVYPADDKEELTPLEMPSVPSVRQPKALKTYRVTWIEVEADTPLSATRRSPFLPDAAGHDGFPRSACAPLSVTDLQSRST
jgi:hypothetical protein